MVRPVRAFITSDSLEFDPYVSVSKLLSGLTTISAAAVSNKSRMVIADIEREVILLRNRLIA
jgi:hypothetical protein